MGRDSLPQKRERKFLQNRERERVGRGNSSDGAPLASWEREVDGPEK